MRALASFVMRGPWQATGVAVVTAAMPMMFWISAAVICLVVLRVGIARGLTLALWAFLPALAWVWLAGEPTVAMVLLEALVMAVMLGRFASWQSALLAGAVTALSLGMALPVVLPELLALLTEVTAQFYERVAPDFVAQMGDAFPAMMQSLMLGSLSVSVFFMATGSLMLARGWQAGLYNPGGFRREFHSFRLTVPGVLACMGAMFLLPLLGLDPVLASMVFGMPMLLAGFALVHGLLGARSSGRFWLILFYVVLLMFGLSLVPLLVVLAMIDSWLDIRSRVSKS